MANNYYQIYINNVFDLANTLSIKFDQAAQALNNKVMIDYGYDAVNLDDPNSWRYYQNISGTYHFSNPAMSVVSLDTLESIPFDKVTLSQHPATLQAYQYGTRYYKDLLAKYPDNELLIRGILYPCDIDYAIAAKDATILSYPTHLVDSNEYSFISNLQDWLYDYFARWVNKQYTIAHDLYVPMYMGQLYLHLIPAIVNIRLSACKTSEAHSFHVRQYLASHGMLDVFLSAMTKEQALFFYRNIDYIEANAGKRSTFDWLVENVLTLRGLPLYEYDAKHSLNYMLPSEANEFTYTDRAEVLFRRLPINYPTVDPKRNIFGLSDVLDKIKDQAPENISYNQDNERQINDALVDSDSNTIITKLLESAIKDYGDTVPYRLSDILLNEWLSMAFSGRYSAYVTVTFPVTKKDVTFSVIDAFILYTYCVLKATGVDATNLPTIIASRVYKVDKPDLDWMYDYFKYSHLSTDQIKSVFLNNPPTTAVRSVSGFYERARGIYGLTLQHYRAESSNEHCVETGELKVANSQLFEDRLFHLESRSETPLYTEWLSARGYAFTKYTPEDFLNLAEIIYEGATGAAANKLLSIKDIQRAMVSLFTRLSSYSIQMASDVDTSKVFLVPGVSVKIGDRFDSVQDNGTVKIPIVTVRYNLGIEKSRIPMDNDIRDEFGYITCKESDLVAVDYSSEGAISMLVDEYSSINVEVSPMRVRGADYQDDYDELSAEQKLELFELHL